LGGILVVLATVALEQRKYKRPDARLGQDEVNSKCEFARFLDCRSVARQ